MEKKFFIYHDDFSFFIDELERTKKDVVKELKIAEGIHPRNSSFSKKIVETRHDELRNRYAQDMPLRKDQPVDDKTMEGYENFLRTIAHIQEAEKKEKDLILLVDPLTYSAINFPASFYQKVVDGEKIKRENFLYFIKKIRMNEKEMWYLPDPKQPNNPPSPLD